MGVILKRAALTSVVSERQARGERAVCTNGIFDLLHLGHVAYLQQARALGDLLVVCINSDASTRRLKGPTRPITPELERAVVLAALACIDYVTIFGENTAESLVAALQPAIYVKGADYAGGSTTAISLNAETLRRALAGDADTPPAVVGLGSRLPEAAVVASYGGELALLSYLPGHSTTELIQRIVSRYAPPPEATSPTDGLPKGGGGRGSGGRSASRPDLASPSGSTD